MTTGLHPTLFIQEFELELALVTGESKEFEYEFDGRTRKAEVEVCSGDQKLEWEGEQALAEVQALFDQLEIRYDANPFEIAGRALRVLGVDWKQVKSLEVEIKFSDGREWEWEYEARQKEA